MPWAMSQSSADRYGARSAGFTLVEVLIALAILAIALAAATRAASTATTSAEETKLRSLALWVAQNRAAELSARRVFPGVGSESGNAQMGGVEFVWSQRTAESPNPAFRKVVIEVKRVGGDGRGLAALSTYLTRGSP